MYSVKQIFNLFPIQGKSASRATYGLQFRVGAHSSGQVQETDWYSHEPWLRVGQAGFGAKESGVD